jgi:hypothetical protein
MVGIATGNGVDSQEIEFSRPKPRPIQPPVQEVPGSIRRVKRQERGAATYPGPSSAGLQMDWQIYLPFPTAPAQARHRVTFTFNYQYSK